MNLVGLKSQKTQMMLTKNKIKTLWKNAGWNSETDYHIYLKVIGHGEKIDLLNPDRVSPKAFWKATDEWFGTDTVCNTKLTTQKSLTIENCNEQNHKIALYSGLLGVMELAIENMKRKFNGEVSIGEIGCGHGSFYRNFFLRRDDIRCYFGFDVVKRFSNCLVVEGKDGTFTKKQVEFFKNRINIFYSSNVFQHLSPKKIKKYLRQMYEILPFGGSCVLMYVKPPKTKHSYHYGQAVEIMETQEFYEACRDVGFEIEMKVEQSIVNNKTFNVLGVFLTKIINNGN
jgi:hypothetical protein